MWLISKALIPAKAPWASEICPTYPVITTTDSATQATLSDAANAYL